MPIDMDASAWGMSILDGDRNVVFIGPSNLEYADEHYEHDDELDLKILTNELATITGEISYFDPYTLVKIIGPRWFGEFATRWACFERKDLSNRMRNAKKKRIRKKYTKRILDAYMDYLRGGKT